MQTKTDEVKLNFLIQKPARESLHTPHAPSLQHSIVLWKFTTPNDPIMDITALRIPARISVEMKEVKTAQYIL